MVRVMVLFAVALAVLVPGSALAADYSAQARTFSRPRWTNRATFQQLTEFSGHR